MLKAYPRLEAVQRVVSARETQAFAGNEVSRHPGEGIEYADLRDFVAGDRVRSINWRASARRQSLVVNERHPERNTDVVILVDSFVDLGGEKAARSTTRCEPRRRSPPATWSAGTASVSSATAGSSAGCVRAWVQSSDTA